MAKSKAKVSAPKPKAGKGKARPQESRVTKSTTPASKSRTTTPSSKAPTIFTPESSPITPASSPSTSFSAPLLSLNIRSENTNLKTDMVTAYNSGGFRMLELAPERISLQARRALRRAQRGPIPAPSTASLKKQQRLEKLKKELTIDLGPDNSESLPPYKQKSQPWYRCLHEAEEAVAKLVTKKDLGDKETFGKEGPWNMYFEEPMLLRSGRWVFATGNCHCMCMKTTREEKDEIDEVYGWEIMDTDEDDD